MSAPTNLPLAIQIGSIWRSVFNWWVLVCGKDSSGNPQPLKVGTDGTLGTTSKQFSASSSSTPATADATVFTLAAGQRGFIQNLDDVGLAVKYGASASASDFTFILKAGTATDDGLGGACIIDDWIGVVSVAALTGSPRFIATKLS